VSEQTPKTYPIEESDLQQIWIDVNEAAAALNHIEAMLARHIDRTYYEDDSPPELHAMLWIAHMGQKALYHLKDRMPTVEYDVPF